MGRHKQEDLHRAGGEQVGGPQYNSEPKDIQIFFFLHSEFIVHCLHNKTSQCYEEHYIRDPGHI